MKLTSYFLATASVVFVQTVNAQKVTTRKYHTKHPLATSTRHVLTQLSPRIPNAMALATTARTNPLDTLRNRLLAKGNGPTVPTKPLAVATATPSFSANAEERDRLQIANPRLVSELPEKPYLMPLDKASVRGSYPLGISATKTTHIIFPSKIREFDAGTDYVMAQVPENVSNVLRVKANAQSDFCLPGSTAETNMTIITDDGNFYSFLVRHQADPEVLNITIANNRPSDEQRARMQGINPINAVPVMLTTGPASSRTTNRTDISDTKMRQYCQRIYERKGFIRRVGDSKFRIISHLNGLYVSGKIMYLQLDFCNKSGIDYDVDFVKFYLRDRDVLKRQAAQEIELTPFLAYPTDLRAIKANTKNKAVYALPLRTLGDDKVLEVELYERDGGRHLRFRVDSKVLLRARML